MSGITIQVKVKPNARQSVLLPPVEAGAPWTAQLKSPPVDGKANTELIALVAKHFGCGKARVRIRSGAGAKLKLIQVDAPGQ